MSWFPGLLRLIHRLQNALGLPQPRIDRSWHGREQVRARSLACKEDLAHWGRLPEVARRTAVHHGLDGLMGVGSSRVWVQVPPSHLKDNILVNSLA